MPVTAMKWPNTVAPATMVMIMAVISRVSLIESQNLRRSNDLLSSSDDDGGRCADTRGLGGAEEPREQAADDQREEKQHLDEAGQTQQLLPSGWCCPRPGPRWD